jgi:hypothetical protein
VPACSLQQDAARRGPKFWRAGAGTGTLVKRCEDMTLATVEKYQWAPIIAALRRTPGNHGIRHPKEETEVLLLAPGQRMHSAMLSALPVPLLLLGAVSCRVVFAGTTDWDKARQVTARILCRTTPCPPSCRNIRPRVLGMYVVDKAESVRHIRRLSSCPLINSSASACWYAAKQRRVSPFSQRVQCLAARSVLAGTTALRTHDGSAEQHNKIR